MTSLHLSLVFTLKWGLRVLDYMMIQQQNCSHTTGGFSSHWRVSLKQHAELMLLQQTAFSPGCVCIIYLCLCLLFGAIHSSQLCSSRSLMKEPVWVFPTVGKSLPDGSLEMRAALTSSSLHLSTGTVTLNLWLCAQILKYQDEQREESLCVILEEKYRKTSLLRQNERNGALCEVVLQYRFQK